MIENVIYNNSTNLLNKCSQPKANNANIKVSEPQKDEVDIKQINNKKKGNKILKTILGFGSSSAIGGFIGLKGFPKIEKQLQEKANLLQEKLFNFKDSSPSTSIGEMNYKKLTKAIYDIENENGGFHQAFVFEGTNKTLANNIMDWIGNNCIKNYKIIDEKDIYDTAVSLHDTIAKGCYSNKLQLVRVDNLAKCLKKDADKDIVSSVKYAMNNCGKITNTILMFHYNDYIHNIYRDIAVTDSFQVDEMRDFNKYAKLYKKHQITEKTLSNISKLTKTKAITTGIVAGLAVATGIFAFLKIRNKGKKNENISNSNK